MVSRQTEGTVWTNQAPDRTNTGQTKPSVRTNPADLDKPSLSWIAAASDSRQLFVVNQTADSPLDLYERVVYSFLLLPLREDRGASKNRIMAGTGLGEVATSTSIRRLAEQGLIQTDPRPTALQPTGEVASWFTTRRGTERLPWHEKFSFWVMHLRSQECPLSYDQSACLWLLLDLARRGRTVGQSHAGLGQLLGVSYKTVQRAIHTLQKLGVIWVNYRGKGGGRRFDFFFNALVQGFADWWDMGDEKGEDAVDPSAALDQADEPLNVAVEPLAKPAPAEPVDDLSLAKRFLKQNDIPAASVRNISEFIEAGGQIEQLARIVSESWTVHKDKGRGPHPGGLVQKKITDWLRGKERDTQKKDEYLADLDIKIAESREVWRPVTDRLGVAVTKCPRCGESVQDIPFRGDWHSPEAEAAAVDVRELMGARLSVARVDVRRHRCRCPETRHEGVLLVALRNGEAKRWWFPALERPLQPPTKAATPKTAEDDFLELLAASLKESSTHDDFIAGGTRHDDEWHQP